MTQIDFSKVFELSNQIFGIYIIPIILFLACGTWYWLNTQVHHGPVGDFAVRQFNTPIWFRYVSVIVLIAFSIFVIVFAGE